MGSRSKKLKKTFDTQETTIYEHLCHGEKPNPRNQKQQKTTTATTTTTQPALIQLLQQQLQLRSQAYTLKSYVVGMFGVPYLGIRLLGGFLFLWGRHLRRFLAAFLHHLKGLSYEMDLAFDDMYG
jgi:hypothetical protein